MMTDQRMLAALGLAAFGPCPFCGIAYPGPAEARPEDVAAGHRTECHVHLGAELEFLLDEAQAKLDVAEYARLKAADETATAARRWELRDAITDHLGAGGYGIDAWEAWWQLCGDPVEDQAEAADTGLAALRVAGLL